jgi:methyl-accepting chemotaxis protein
MKRLQLASTDGALELNDAVAKFNAYAGTVTAQMLDQAQHDFAVSELTTAAALAAALALFAFIYAGILRAVLEPLNEAGDHFEAIASGDLTAKIVHNGTNEMHTLFEGLRKMQASLSEIVSTVRSGAVEINVGVAEIVTGNNNLSARTEQQAASLEETAASMEQLTATVKQNSESAAQASSLASSASEVAFKGSAVVGRVVETMVAISTESSKIGDITGIIEGIAFQTNILALNAAVEAARAGEQGRGFAVVASEVRNLAQRSSSAAKEIKELISTSARKIENGAELASEAGKTMSEVTNAVARVNDIIGEIAAASGEQRQGIEQVNTAITQMDEATQHNAALVEEATAASQAVEEQGRRLTQAISSFNLGVCLS